jgi:oligopeptide transport system permease protein
MAKKPGGVVDKIGNIFVVLNYAIPGLVFYLLMQKVLSGPFGYGYDALEPEFYQLIPGIFSMAFLSIPGIIIWLRRFMLNELNSDYVKFARSKGLSENRIMYTHVLRNAIVPLARNIPATFLGAIVGSYFVEKIWTIPGTGDMLISALTSMDIPVIQSLTVIYSVIGMVAFLLGDLITVFFDPRIKLVE